MTYKQLSPEQRQHIYALFKANLSQMIIAEITGVNQSTISRELHRNGGLNGYGCPHPSLFEACRKKSNSRKTKLTPGIINIIESRLMEKWSPEQISGWLKREMAISISHQTIYVYIRKDKKAGGTLYQHLRRKGKPYRPRKTDRTKIKNRISINERPDIVDDKIRVGDWEIDTVVGKAFSGFLVTIVERKTRFTVSSRVNDKSASTVTKAVIELLKPYKDTVLTITADNGTEFAYHKKIAKALGTIVYFADPYCSWQRGLNENTNGLLRQYWPKKTNFKKVSNEEVATVIQQLNDRPRSRLGFKTPNDMMKLHLEEKHK